MEFSLVFRSVSHGEERWPANLCVVSCSQTDSWKRSQAGCNGWGTDGVEETHILDGVGETPGKAVTWTSRRLNWVVRTGGGCD
jgi:hypothetical protein